MKTLVLACFLTISMMAQSPSQSGSGGGGGASLPPQATNANKTLATDGSNASWNRFVKSLAVGSGFAPITCASGADGASGDCTLALDVAAISPTVASTDNFDFSAVRLRETFACETATYVGCTAGWAKYAVGGGTHAKETSTAILGGKIGVIRFAAAAGSASNFFVLALHDTYGAVDWVQLGADIGSRTWAVKVRFRVDSVTAANHVFRFGANLDLTNSSMSSVNNAMGVHVANGTATVRACDGAACSSGALGTVTPNTWYTLTIWKAASTLSATIRPDGGSATTASVNANFPAAAALIYGMGVGTTDTSAKTLYLDEFALEVTGIE